MEALLSSYWQQQVHNCTVSCLFYHPECLFCVASNLEKSMYEKNTSAYDSSPVAFRPIVVCIFLIFILRTFQRHPSRQNLELANRELPQGHGPLNYSSTQFMKIFLLYYFKGIRISTCIEKLQTMKKLYDTEIFFFIKQLKEDALQKKMKFN